MMSPNTSQSQREREREEVQRETERERERERRSKLVPTLAPRLVVGLGGAGLGLGCAIEKL